MQFPKSLQPIKPSLSLSNSLNASRSSESKREEGMNVTGGWKITWEYWENYRFIFTFFHFLKCHIPSISSGLNSRSCEGSQCTVRIQTRLISLKSCQYAVFLTQYYAVKKKKKDNCWHVHPRAKSLQVLFLSERKSSSVTSPAEENMQTLGTLWGNNTVGIWD